MKGEGPMKKSIQTKIIALIMIGIFLSVVIIGGIGIYSFRQEMKRSSHEIMHVTCDEKAEELDGILGRMEQSVDLLSVLSVNYLEDMAQLKDTEYREHYIAHMSEVGHSIASHTDGALSIYFRLAPEIAGSSSEFYWIRNQYTGQLESIVVTDLHAYEKSDVAHVGWYYQPVEAGHAIWMAPYENANIHKKVVTYVVPVYVGDTLLGIVGIDIDFQYISSKVDEIRLYETGHAFLADENFCVTYSPDLEEGTDLKEVIQGLTDGISEDEEQLFDCVIHDEAQKVAFSQLSNGRYMCVIAPKEEINLSANQLILRIIVISASILVVFVIAASQIARTIIHPLKELNQAAIQIANGNLDVSLDYKQDNEIGTLASSLKETAHQLKVRIDYINNLAYSDKLTGVKNNTAYMRDITFLKEEIMTKAIDFAVFIIDANGLKHMNDVHGHEKGNELVIKLSRMITDVFGKEAVYRIGGDEFAVILKNTPMELCEKYKHLFMEMIQVQKGKIWASAAIGYAVYNPTTDSLYENVFNRADEEMYAQKSEMKAFGDTSRLIEE